MSFELTHIWASMGTLGKMVAGVLLLMGIACVGITVERLIVLWKSGRQSRRFAGPAAAAINGWQPQELLKLCDQKNYKASVLARLFAPIIKRYLDAGEGGPAVETFYEGPNRGESKRLQNIEGGKQFVRRELSRHGADVKEGLYEMSEALPGPTKSEEIQLPAETAKGVTVRPARTLTLTPGQKISLLLTARDPDGIPVGRVMEAAIGPLRLMDCIDPETECRFKEACASRRITWSWQHP